MSSGAGSSSGDGSRSGEEGRARPLPRWEGEPPEVWAGRWGIPRFEAWAALPSTNDRVRALAEKDAPPFTAVTAEEQTAGRGRGGRSWASPAGKGLWLSLLTEPAVPGGGALLPLRAGLATARAVEEVTGLVVGIKWPNDLLVGGRKVAGVLCEGVRGRVVVGIGINVRQGREDFPPDLRSGAASLEMLSESAVSRADLAAAIVRDLVRRVEEGGEALGPTESEELARRDLLEGRRVVLSSGPRGRASGIGRDGALRVVGAGGRALRARGGSVVEVEPPLTSPPGDAGAGAGARGSAGT